MLFLDNLYDRIRNDQDRKALHLFLFDHEFDSEAVRGDIEENINEETSNIYKQSDNKTIPRIIYEYIKETKCTLFYLFCLSFN